MSECSRRKEMHPEEAEESAVPHLARKTAAGCSKAPKMAENEHFQQVYKSYLTEIFPCGTMKKMKTWEVQS